MITLFIIFGTVAISIIAFYQTTWSNKLLFSPFLVNSRKEWTRFFTYGLIHADWIHLGINMYVLYSFGRLAESLMYMHFGNKSYLYYLLLYTGGIMFSVLFDYGKYRNDPYYSAVGASGAVSAVVFSSIVLYPYSRISLIFIPIGIPSVIFGVLYLVYSAIMAKRGSDNIGHNAHFWGAVYGAVYTVLLKPALLKSLINSVF